MKKFSCLALGMLMAASLLAGCRDRNQPMETTRPTTAPTTAPTTMPAARPEPETTLPTTGTTPSETMDTGNGPLDTTDSTGATGETDATAEGRSIHPMPKSR